MQWLRTGRLCAGILISLVLSGFVCAQDRAAKAAAEKACENGRRFLALKEYDKAIDAFSQAIAIDPNSDEALFARGVIHCTRPDAKKRQVDSAIADFSQFLQLRPGSYKALFNRAFCYREKMDIDNAIRDLTEIIEAKTDFTQTVEGKDKCLSLTHYTRGEMYLDNKKDYSKAIKDFTESLRLNPKIDELAHYGRAKAYLALREYAKAIADFAAETERHPSYATVLVEFARLLASCPDATHRDGKKALQYAQQANKLTRSKNPRVLDAIATAYAELGEFREAVAWQKKAIELLGDMPATGVSEEMKARLVLYQMNKPFRIK